MNEAPLKEHRRCGCPEQYKGMDCPACRGTGLIPPVNRDEWVAAVNEREALRRENERLRDAVRLALDIAEDGLVDFKAFGLSMQRLLRGDLSHE